MSAATITMPASASVGFLSHMTPPKKPKVDEPQTKHSFDSDEETTRILHHVLRVGTNKAKFINLCIRYAATEAFQELAAERKSAEQEFWRVLSEVSEQDGGPSASSKRKHGRHSVKHEEQQ